MSSLKVMKCSPWAKHEHITEWKSELEAKGVIIYKMLVYNEPNGTYAKLGVWSDDNDDGGSIWKWVREIFLISHIVKTEKIK